MPLDGPNIARFFCRHLVGICLVVRERSNNRIEQTEIFSAFAMSVKGRWLLLTAGHCLRRLDQFHSSATYEVIACGLYDGWTPSAPVDLIPFRYTDSTRDYIDSDELGVDIGFIEIPPFLQRTLMAGGVEPLGVEHWAAVDEGFISYAVLGQPTELVRVVRNGPGIVDSKVDPVLVSLERCEPPPHMIKPAARFYGKLAPQIQFLDGGVLFDFDGMSGGPIFGVRQLPDGRLSYSLIAVQGSWEPSIRVVAGARVWWLAAALIDALETRGEVAGALSRAGENSERDKSEPST